jgi:flagellar assembly protein FliH
VVESRTNSVDATIEKRWLRAIGNLGLSEPWNPADADV